jgi:biotin operon repressor
LNGLTGTPFPAPPNIMDKKPQQPYGYVLNLRVLREAAYDGSLQNMTARIFSIIVTYADQHGACFPSLTQIAKRLGITRQAVQNQLRKLKNLGYVEIFYQKEKRTNIYKLRRTKTGCPPPQPQPVDSSATSLGCPKKPLKKLIEENRQFQPIRQTVKRQIEFNQGKRREAETGLSKNDEQYLAETMQRAVQGMSISARVTLDLDLRQEAARLPISKKDQHQFITERYAALYAERCEKGEINV